MYLFIGVVLRCSSTDACSSGSCSPAFHVALTSTECVRFERFPVYARQHVSNVQHLLVHEHPINPLLLAAYSLCVSMTHATSVPSDMPPILCGHTGVPHPLVGPWLGDPCQGNLRQPFGQDNAKYTNCKATAAWPINVAHWPGTE